VCRASSGQSSIAYVKRCRMALAHEILHRVDRRDTTVTNIATFCGFHHFGRLRLIISRSTAGRHHRHCVSGPAGCSPAQPEVDVMSCSYTAIQNASAEYSGRRPELPTDIAERRHHRRALDLHAVEGGVGQQQLILPNRGTLASGAPAPAESGRGVSSLPEFCPSCCQPVGWVKVLRPKRNRTYSP
jgi:hypothetical protein